MLQIKEISKQYQTGELVQRALDEVSLNFRDNEFVAILGPSGSGKTTLLNIVGGLDRYDSGDLIINDVSTKDYKDADWDSYRNHTIGFVFQSYNLIPHQTVLSNVELALTIGGISPKERKERALEALRQVGLDDQAHKKPTQMSGGQMQRVAIARALVNNPDILLADEPTGALDTETSVQVMDLLKEVAKDRLVIMVTHNPELAEDYATRIVKLRDGRIIDDSDPFIPDEEILAPAEHRNLSKASMSFKTALSLSLNNLMTKKARTILTAFAGSIGIIGIALILSLSTGFHNYINQIQEETLTSYPLSITADTADMTAALLAMVPAGSDEESGEDKDIVKEMQVMSSMFGSVGKNDLKSFKKYLEDNQERVAQDVALIQYQYGASPMIFTKDCKKEISKLNPNQILNTMSGYSMDSVSIAMTSVFHELVDDQKMLDEQYDVLAGRWPKAKDEAVIVLQDPNTIPDLLVYSLGLRDPGELKKMITKLMAGETVKSKNNPMEFTYEELMDIKLKVVDASETYRYNSDFDFYEDMSEDQDFMKSVYKDGMPLKITGVMCMKDGASSMSSMVGVCYTPALTKHVIKTAKESPIVKRQLEDKEFNVFTGKRFDDESDDIGLDFQDMITIDENALSAAFGGNVSEETMTATGADATADMNLTSLGYQNLNKPTLINIYFKDFDSKESFIAFLDEYNDKMEKEDEDKVISYTDITGLLMSSVSTIVDSVTYVLIAFVSISLIVSSIMIGIITYISVLERTKEIGILRAIGASKRNISSIFNAETFIVGLFAGVLGIIVTLILNIPINYVIHTLTGNPDITAVLPAAGGALLIILSVILTLISGLIPSKQAAKKDPVLALRSE